MTRNTLIAACLATLLCPLLGGCTVDQYAQMAVEQDTTWSKTVAKIVGTPEQLVQAGKISWGRRFLMPDDVEIDVWGIRSAQKPSRGTVLILHGLNDSKVTYLPMATKLVKKGFDVVLPDFRAHGRSTGKYVTFGALETADTKRVMDTLLAEKAVASPLYVFGPPFNLGGSVAILYAAADSRVAGVVAVAPSRDYRSTIRRFRWASLLDDQTIEKVVQRAGKIGKFNPDDASAINAVGKIRCPILLIHGQLDLMTPVADSQALYDAARQPKELQVLTWAGHLGTVIGRENDMIKDIERVAGGKLITTEPTPAKE